jgi:acetyl esterase
MTKTYVRGDVAKLLAMAAENPRPSLRSLGPVATRDTMRSLGMSVDLPLGALAVRKDIAAPGADGATIATRLFDSRTERPPGPLVLYLHGGGFVFGDLDTHAPVCAEFARQLDLPVLAVDYRLAPEHPWPAAQDDCRMVAGWLSRNPTGLGFKPTGLVICGDSAGAWLAVVVALALLQEKAALQVQALGLIYPLIDRNCTRYESFEECGSGYTLTADGMNWFIECFAPDMAHPYSELSSAVRADLPPTVVISAGLDPLRDQGRAFAAALAKVGGTSVYLEAAGQVHGFVGSRKAIPSAVQDLDDFLTMLEATLKLARPQPSEACVR